jgi:alpha-L-fucosidase
MDDLLKPAWNALLPHRTPQWLRVDGDTTRDNLLYAILLGWPRQPVRLKTLAKLYPGEVRSVRMLGVDRELTWSADAQGLVVNPPDQRPYEHAFAIKIERKDI